MKKAQIVDVERRTRKPAVSTLSVAAALCACSGAPGSDASAESWSEEEFLPPASSDAQPKQSSLPASPDEQSGLAARAFGSGNLVWKRWKKGQSTVVLAPHRTHVCALSMVQGEFRLGTSVDIGKSGDNWILRGWAAGENTLAVDAVCAALSGFRVNAGASTALGAIVTVTNPFQRNTTWASLPANTAPILLRVQGEQNGFGEYKFVELGPNPTVAIQNGTAQPPHTATAVPLSFGAPRMPLYTVDKVRDMSPSNPELCQSCQLVPIAGNFCYLAGVGGNLNGAEEWVQVYPDFATGHWRWGVNSGSGLFSTGSVKARFNCLSDDQRVTITDPR